MNIYMNPWWITRLRKIFTQTLSCIISASKQRSSPRFLKPEAKAPWWNRKSSVSHSAMKLTFAKIGGFPWLITLRGGWQSIPKLLYFILKLMVTRFHVHHEWKKGWVSQLGRRKVWQHQQNAGWIIWGSAIWREKTGCLYCIVSKKNNKKGSHFCFP